MRIKDGRSAREVLYESTADIAPGEELFVDYGALYDRSQYKVDKRG